VSRKKIHKRHRIKKTGIAPGTLEYTGNKHSEKSIIIRSVFDETSLDIKENGHYQKNEIANQKLWLDVRGLSDTAFISKICNEYGIHTLAQEDILNVYQRPKIEELDGGSFIVFKAIQAIGDESEPIQMESQQVSIYFDENQVLSFQENVDDLFFAIRERLKKDNSRLRTGGTLYMIYALLDLIVDHYVALYHRFDQKTDALEEQVDGFDDPDFKLNVHHLKQDLLQFRRAIFPIREVISRLIRNATDNLVTDKLPFLRDLHDHMIILIEDLDECNDRLKALHELYHIYLQQKTNLVVQTLTIISTIFIPITFVAGVYGMNFHNMPELEWRYGYWMVWGIMLLMVSVMIMYFKRKKWF
jgi:magnesium transporter